MNRITLFQKTLNDDEGALILSDINRYYFTGVSSSAGLLFITNKSINLSIDFRYIEYAKKSAFNGVKVSMAKSYDILSFLKENNAKTVYIEDDIPAKDYKNLCEHFNIKFLNGKIEKLRSVKEKDEIDFIKKSQQITDKAFENLLNFIKEGKTEKEIKARLIYELYRNGAEKLAFEPVVVSGKNGSLPHGNATDKPLKNGDFLTLDFGAKYMGYCSDMTRTVAIGNASDEMKSVYEIVLNAQQKAFEKIKAGVLGKKVDLAARKVIENAGYGENFGHATGHGVGLFIHEIPSFSPSFDKPVEKNAIISVEPGIYIENKFGVRIEDLVIVTENGYENITKSPKNLITLK